MLPRSLAALTLVVVSAVACSLPAGAAALTFGRDTGHRAGAVAPGPGGDLWAIGDRLELRRPDGSPRLRINVGVTGDTTRLAAGPDGSAWLDVAGKPQLQRISPTGRRTVYRLPRNPYGRSTDSLDVAPSGTVWTTASSVGANGEPDGFVRVIRRPLHGQAAVSARLRSADTTALAATGDRDAWMGVPCGMVHVRLVGRRLRIVGRQHRCAGLRSSGPMPMALGRAPDGALWRVLNDGRVIRGAGAGARTVARLGRMESKLGRWDAGPISIAFTGRDPVRAWVQTELTVVEATARGAHVHAIPPRMNRELGQIEPLAALASDRRGRLWGIFDGRVTPIQPDRCAVPRVVGLTSRTAVRTLRSRDCAPELRTPRGLRPGNGRVVRQSRPAGSTVPAGTRVVLSERRYQPRCYVDPRGRKLLHRSARWTVMRDTSGDHASAIIACDRRTGREWTVVDPEWEDEFDETSLSVAGFAGDWLLLTYAQESGISHEGGGEGTSLFLADLVRRHRTTVTSYGSSWWDDPSTAGGGNSVFGTAFSSPRLDTHGNVAWLEPHAVVLRLRGKDRAEVAADPATTYAQLRFDGTRLRWTADGVEQGTPVP